MFSKHQNPVLDKCECYFCGFCLPPFWNGEYQTNIESATTTALMDTSYIVLISRDNRFYISRCVHQKMELQSINDTFNIL